ncbi:MAG: hypothetical protein HKM93_23160 [Desulfobacteraceae bacterium]|nr:hypothetical protein [Desulfobacteraceae bacterium]
MSENTTQPTDTKFGHEWQRGLIIIVDRIHHKLFGTEALHLLPKEKIVVEVLEDVAPTANIITACKELRENGYILALDDFEYKPGLEQLISLANIIKFDFLLTPPDHIRGYPEELSGNNRLLLAEKVDTHGRYHARVTPFRTDSQGPA